jgi:S-adenosylmethionine-diacylgycerolhomoserine-N-methlytransferase
MATAARDHAALMDSVYRGQRHIYDATRKYFLFGRDTLIDRLDARPGQAVLEIACGTGRNLHKIGKRWPGVTLHGLDISAEMLKNAQAKLGGGAQLARGDATAFDPQALFGRENFDRVVLSFAVSMIPEWQAAVEQAAAVLAPGGSLHVVDFGDLAGLPGPFRAALRAWLAHFHVTPRVDLAEFAVSLAAEQGLQCKPRRGPMGYYRLVTITRR